MRGRWQRSDDGFVTAYFLVILLIVMALISVQALNLSNRLKCTENIVKINRYLAAENEILQDVKCTLKQCIEDGTEIPYETDGRIIYMAAADPPETIEITYDAETGTVYDYTVYRSEE